MATPIEIMNKQYIDAGLALKADKSVTYTKVETDARIQSVVGAAPAALDTLKELADSLNDDPSFAATVTNALSLKADKTSIPTTLPANGGNADTVDGLHASAFALASHNHTTLSGVTGIGFNTDSSDSASITTTVSGPTTTMDFNLSDDPGQDYWRWQFTPSGATVFEAMALKPVSSTAANLAVKGEIYSNGYKAWHAGNFDPSLKADASNVYSKSDSDARYIPMGASCNKNWSYSGRDGQPAWLWGTNDGSNMYVYNPANFNVNYANGAGNSDTVDGLHASAFAPVGHTSVVGSSGIGHVKNGGNVIIDASGNMNVSIPTTLPANGGNADTVDGYHASAFAPSGYGLGTISTDISSQNLNNYQITGFFKGSSVVNAPNDGWFWFIIQAHDNSSWTSQIAISFGASNTQNIMYTRTNSQGTWSGWAQIAKTTDIPTTLPANGGNSDTVDGCHASAFAAASHTHSAGQISGLATVAYSGNYNDLSNKPTIPTTLPANGGNSDTVDGYHGTQFLRNDTSGTLSGNLTVTGDITGGRVLNAIYNDYAEFFEKENKDEILEAGDVVIKQKDGKYIKSSIEYDKNVVGVYSDSFGHILGGEKEKTIEENSEKFIPIGLAGRVFVKVSGDIEQGDMLTTSNLPGVAMKANEYKMGTIIGKALQSHSGDNIDRIEMLIINM